MPDEPARNHLRSDLTSAQLEATREIGGEEPSKMV
jgi:hypothetical protein